MEKHWGFQSTINILTKILELPGKGGAVKIAA